LRHQGGDAHGPETGTRRAEAYIARTSKRISKQRHLIVHSRNEQTVATARDLVEVLTALLTNVEHRHHRLQSEAERAAAKRRH
jgi:hypothetical protein